MPVYRIPTSSHRHHGTQDAQLLYHIKKDPEQSTPVRDSKLHQKYENKLEEFKQRYQALDWQYTRVGLGREQ